MGINELNGSFVTEVYCPKVDAVLIELDKEVEQVVTQAARTILLGRGFVYDAPTDCGLTTTPRSDRTLDSFIPCFGCDHPRIRDLTTEE